MIISVLICLAVSIVGAFAFSSGGMNGAKDLTADKGHEQITDTHTDAYDAHGDGQSADIASAETVVFAETAARTGAGTALNSVTGYASPDEVLGETDREIPEGNSVIADDMTSAAEQGAYVAEERLHYSFSMDAFTGRNREAENEEPAEDDLLLGLGSTEADVVLSLLSDAENITSYGQMSSDEAAEASQAELETKEQKLRKKLDEIPLPADVPSSLTYIYNPSFRMSISDKERNILYRIVQAEAGDQDIYGRILVANVVLNRVFDRRFPGDIESVVFQKIGGATQFAPTKDGRYWTVTVTSKTIEAVDRALRGEDYSKGALYFFQRNLTSTSMASWFDNSLTKLFKYGSHEFFTEK